MFSKACEHGIKALIYIATQSIEGKRVKIGDVAEHAGSPEAFTAKVLGLLAKFDIVKSHKGPYGGFEIELNRMKEVKMIDIVSAIDGDTIFNGCALGLHECSDIYPCPMHDHFLEVKLKLKKMLSTSSIYDLAQALKSGKTVLMKSID